MACQYKGKQKEESEATMGSPLLHKRQVAGAPLPPTLPAVYMLADIPAEVDIPLPKRLKDDCGAHVATKGSDHILCASFDPASNYFVQ